MKNNTKEKKIVVKVVEDLVYVGVMVGLTVVEWKLIGRIDRSNLGRIRKTLMMIGLDVSIGCNINAIANRIFKSFVRFRKANEKEFTERMEELVKKFENDPNLNAAYNVIDSMDENELMETMNKLLDLGDVLKSMDEVSAL